MSAYTLLGAAGQPVDLEVHSQPLRSDADRALIYVAIDVTEQRRAE